MNRNGAWDAPCPGWTGPSDEQLSARYKQTYDWFRVPPAERAAPIQR